MPAADHTRIVHIYALIDPHDNAVRYVGKAADPYHRRKRHLAERCFGPRRRWLDSLQAENLVPILVILESVPESCWQEAERSWIAFYRQIGADLTNERAGGNGCGAHDELSREKIRQRFLEKPKTPEHIAKLSQNQKGRKQSKNAAKKSRAALKKAQKAMKGKPRPYVALLPQNQPGYSRLKKKPAQLLFNWKVAGGTCRRYDGPSPEQRLTQSQTTRGRKHSPEHSQNAFKARLVKRRKSDHPIPRTRILWPEFSWIEDQLKTHSIVELAKIMKVKRGSLSAHIHKHQFPQSTATIHQFPLGDCLTQT